MDAKGNAFAQRHVAAFLQDATDSMLVMGSLPPMSRAQADQATYSDYPFMVDTVIAKMSSLVTQTQLDEVAFFDDKVLMATEIGNTLVFAYGQRFEELALHTVLALALTACGQCPHYGAWGLAEQNLSLDHEATQG